MKLSELLKLSFRTELSKQEQLQESPSEREFALLDSIANAIEDYARLTDNSSSITAPPAPPFTKRSKRVLHEYANQEAKKLGRDFCGATSVALGLLREDDSVACKLLRNLSIDILHVSNVLRLVGKSEVPIDNGLQFDYIIENSTQEAQKLKHNYVGTEHILLALLKNPDFTTVTASFCVFNVNYNTIKGEILRVLG